MRTIPLVLCWLSALAAWLLPAGLALAIAIGEPVAFPTEAQQRQYQTLIRELRCTVCQSETIHESNAELAADMRRRVRDMTLAGDDREAIIDFMVQRYGDYVRYRPPLQANTAVLWASPFLLLLIGAGVWWQIIRGRKRMSQRPAFTEQERQALDRLRRGE
ncbi:cytochrome c-type biogenesis protein [Halomonas lysinitropha]|uniref:Cytochrome c-type biogenesis protein n=1 Tax=Halomonas lysinitropha TaxID=2607506 RepID=A0A5K1I4C0_9GAMM|nr:cytochrome c-type biogenesis protein [Halomonas lysinitropha]VVZ94012.1 Cytochrome c-type biogenesis protein CcmH precursor [Halomonas lysinitropha]